MAVLNICGFETGGLGSETSSETGAIVGGSGTFTVQTSVVNSGQYALKYEASDANYLGTVISGLSNSGVYATYVVATVYCRIYFYYTARPSSGTSTFLVFRTGASAVKGSCRVNSSGQIGFYDSTNTLSGSHGSTVLALNTWYCIEAMVGTGASASWEVKINNVSEISGTADTTTTDHGDIILGRINSGVTGITTYYYDDICIRDDFYPGPGKIVRLDPVSDSETWTTGTYADVNDYATQAGDDGDTTYSTTSTNLDAISPRVSSASTKGINGTIGCVKGITVCRDENQTVSYNTWLVGTGGSSSPNTAADGTSSYTLRAIIRTNDPGTSEPWKISGIDVCRPRVTHNQSQSRPLRCTAMAVMVDFTPAPIGFMFQPFISGVKRELFKSFIQSMMFSVTDLMELLKPKEYPKLGYAR